MIRFRGVSFAYEPRLPVLRVEELEIGPGLTLVVGPNGSGKSTLLKLAAGVESPDSGAVEVDGHDLWRDEVAARRRLAYLPEHPDVTPYARLDDVVDLVRRLRGEPAAAVGEALARVGLADLRSRSVRELSAGQRRRALLAATLVGRPAHLLLDEPFDAMDRRIRGDMLAWMASRAADGASVVVVSHELEPFLPLARVAVRLAGGEAAAVPLPEGPERAVLVERLARGE